MKKLLSLFLLLSSTALFSMDIVDNANDGTQLNEDSNGFFDLEKEDHKNFWDKYKLGDFAEVDEVFLDECTLRGKEPLPVDFKKIDAKDYYQGKEDSLDDISENWVQSKLAMQFKSSYELNKPRRWVKFAYYTIISPYIAQAKKQEKLDKLNAIELSSDAVVDFKGALGVINDIITDYNNMVVPGEESNQLTVLQQKSSGESGCLIN